MKPLFLFLSVALVCCNKDNSADRGGAEKGGSDKASNEVQKKGPPAWDAPSLGGCLRQAEDSTCVEYIGKSFENSGDRACRSGGMTSPLYSGERCPDRFLVGGPCATAPGTDHETHVFYYDINSRFTADNWRQACASGGGVAKP